MARNQTEFVAQERAGASRGSRARSSREVFGVHKRTLSEARASDPTLQIIPDAQPQNMVFTILSLYQLLRGKSKG